MLSMLSEDAGLNLGKANGLALSGHSEHEVGLRLSKAYLQVLDKHQHGYIRYFHAVRAAWPYRS